MARSRCYDAWARRRSAPSSSPMSSAVSPSRASSSATRTSPCTTSCRCSSIPWFLASSTAGSTAGPGLIVSVEAAHLEGFDLLAPGLVPIEEWRPDGDPPFLPDGQKIPLFAAVARHL